VWFLAPFLLLGCEAAREDDSGTPPETGDSSPPPSCRVGDPEGLDDAFLSDRGNAYRAVEVPLAGGGTGFVMVTFPPEGQTLWADGAGVIVVSPPAQRVDPTWETHPQSWPRPSWGVVEVVAIWPGWTVQGHATPGVGEGGGAEAAAVYEAALAFAVGGPSVEGRPIEDYAEVPVCAERIALLSTSSGGAPLLSAIGSSGAALADRIAGVAVFEPPSLPELAVYECGAIWMDPDTGDDADGDGIPWNDALNQSLDPATCTAEGCAADYRTLAYTDGISLQPLWEWYPADLPAGLLYFDRDGDGRFGVDRRGRTDKNGDGRVSEDEDQWARPLFNTDSAGTHLYYSPTMRRAAEEAGIVPRSAVHLASADATDAWWAERNMGLRAAAAGSALPDATWSVVFTEMPHGPALVERTGEAIVHRELTRGGARPRWNFSREAALCLGGDVYADYAGAPPDDTVLSGAAFQDWALPESVDAITTQAASAVALLLDSRSETPRCPESDE
jgi:hypothetical protein